MQPTTTTPGRAPRQKVVRLRFAYCTFFAALALFYACPSIPIGDPIAHARILNDTNTMITVTIVLEENTQAVDGIEGLRGQLNELSGGPGVTVLSMNPKSRTATYQVDPEGFMVVYEGMGMRPYFSFASMVILQGTNRRSIDGGEEMELAFESGRGRSDSFPFEIRISRAFSTPPGE